MAGFSIERHGDLRTIEVASRKAKEFVQYATELQREPFPVKKLLMSTKCGESDTTTGLSSCPTVGRVFERLTKAGATLIFGETTELTGGEDIIQSRCINEKVLGDFNRMFDGYTDLIKSQGVDLLGSQPTEGNIRGGLTTIEEKAMGNIQKIGRCKVQSALEAGGGAGKARACTSWIRPARRRKWSRCAARPGRSCIISRRARAMSSATRSFR